MHVAPQIVVNCCLLARGGEGGRPNTYIKSEPLLWESSEGLLKITNCQCSPFNSGLCFFMSPQRTWVRAGKVTFARVHLAFHHCAFSYVFSKRLPEKMQSHIDCICLIFLHCAFSYVSSNRMNCFVLLNIVIEYTGHVPNIHPGPISSTNNS